MQRINDIQSDNDFGRGMGNNILAADECDESGRNPHETEAQKEQHMNIWECTIGECGHVLPPGCDLPMRLAVAEAYKKITGVEPVYIFSGWGAKLTEPQRAVVENREPAEWYRKAWHDAHSVEKSAAITDHEGRPLTYGGGIAPASDTPQTDAAITDWAATADACVYADFARKLERERDEARRERDAKDAQLASCYERMDKAEREHAALRTKQIEDAGAELPPEPMNTIWYEVSNKTQYLPRRYAYDLRNAATAIIAKRDAEIAALKKCLSKEPK